MTDIRKAAQESVALVSGKGRVDMLWEFGVSVGIEKVTDEIELPDDMTPEEVQQEFSEWMAGQVDSWYVPKEREPHAMVDGD